VSEEEAGKSSLNFEVLLRTRWESLKKRVKEGENLVLAPMHIAVLLEEKDIIELLLLNGGSVNVLDSIGRAPIDIAEE